MFIIECKNYKDISKCYISNCDLLMNLKITMTWIIVIFNKYENYKHMSYCYYY